jgi:glycolate oxidase FAD binding subunit
MTEVTLKVLPASEHEMTVIIGGLTVANGCKAMSRLLQTPLEISGAVYLPKSDSGAMNQLAESLAGQTLTAFRLEGPEPSVSARLRKAEEYLSPLGPTLAIDTNQSIDFWFGIRELHCFDAEDTSCLMRMVLAPAEAAELATKIERIPDTTVLVDWGGGLIWVGLRECSARDVDHLRELCQLRGGHTTLIKASEALRTECGVFEPLPKAIEDLNSRIRSNFDPHTVLNPGKIRQAL